MKYSEWEQEEFQWLEEKMMQESEDIDIPESLLPEKMLEQLQQVEQKHHNYSMKKAVMIAASFVLVAGISMQLGRIAKDSSKDQNCSVLESCDEVTMDSMEEVENVESGESTHFIVGEGSEMVSDGFYCYTADSDEIIISKLEEEIARVSLGHEIKEYYLEIEEEILLCIASEEANTWIYTISLSQKENPKLIETTVLEGAWSSSCKEEDTISVYTDAGDVYQLDIKSNERHTFSIEK